MANQRYQDGFMFMCEYARSGKAKCKACRNAINKNHLKIGTRGIAYDHWDDSLWFHYRCFWTKCFYRKHVVRLNPNDPDIVGYSELKEADKERVRKSVAKLQEHLKSKEEVTGQPEASSSRSEPKLIAFDWKKHESREESAKPEVATGEHHYKVGTTLCIDIVKCEDGDLKINFTHVADLGNEQKSPCEKSFSISLQLWQKLVSKETVDAINNAITEFQDAKKDDEPEDEPKRKKKKQENEDSDASNIQVIDLLSVKGKVTVTRKVFEGAEQIFVTVEKLTNDDGTENFELTKEEWENLDKIICDINKDLEDNFEVKVDKDQATKS